MKWKSRIKGKTWGSKCQTMIERRDGERKEKRGTSKDRGTQMCHTFALNILCFAQGRFSLKG